MPGKWLKRRPNVRYFDIVLYFTKFAATCKQSVCLNDRLAREHITLDYTV